MSQLRNKIASLLHPHGKAAFLLSLKDRPSILDVGCGNDAVVRIKDVVPDCRYVGVDIADYNLSPSARGRMDDYIKIPEERFAEGIAEIEEKFDGVTSWHNLEHCNDRDATLLAMMHVTQRGGRIFLSFPCEESTGFPTRKGTLNYFDDATHKDLPPSFDHVIKTLKDGGFRIDFSRRRYQPLLSKVAGFLTEPLSRASGRISVGTWAFYGFETIITATREA